MTSGQHQRCKVAADYINNKYPERASTRQLAVRSRSVVGRNVGGQAPAVTSIYLERVFLISFFWSGEMLTV